jgi:hypothetical protein
VEINPLPGQELQSLIVKEGEFPAALIERARRAAGIAAH